MTYKNFVLGYGSLLETESRLRTLSQNTIVYPVKAKGFKRGWFARTGQEGLTTTFLGVVKDESHIINGILYEVDENEFLLTDSREIGYVRMIIDPELIEHYTFEGSESISKDSHFWIYLNIFDESNKLEENLPNEEFPIVQSYVDVCLNGCIEIDRNFSETQKIEFAVDFIKTTHYWSKYWVNDRIYPRRPFIYRPTAYEIDKLLKDNLPEPEILSKIYFE